MWVDLTDVQAAYEKPIPDNLTEFVNHQIGRAERLLSRTLPSLDAWLTDGCLTDDDVKDVVIEAVLRVVRNPGGLQMEMSGNYSYQARADVAGGKLYFSDAELAQLRACALAKQVSANPVRQFRIATPDSRWRP